MHGRGDKVSFRARAGDLFTYFGIGREKNQVGADDDLVDRPDGALAVAANRAQHKNWTHFALLRLTVT